MNLTLDDVRDRVDDDDRGKHDRIVSVRDLTLHHGRLHWPGADDDGFGYALSPWAMAQACSRLGMPAAYFARCPEELRDAQWNHWASVPEESRRKGGGDTGDRWTIRARNLTVRGVLSARYEKLDNRQLLEALIPAFRGDGLEVKLFDLSSESLHLRLTDPRMCRLALPGDPLIVAIHVANSEVGLRAVTIDACLYRQVCSNGMVKKVAGRSLLRQRHIHVDAGGFVPRLSEAVARAKLVAAAFIEQMILSTKTIVPDPDRAIETLADAWKLSRRTAEDIKFGLFGETHSDTLYGLVNAVTNAAQRLPMESRFELETLASVLIETDDENRAAHALRRRVLASA